MSSAVRQPVTIENFLTWEDRQELRYEFDGWEPVAMTGGGPSPLKGSVALYGRRCPMTAGETPAMPEIDVTLALSDIYADVTLPEGETG